MLSLDNEILGVPRNTISSIGNGDTSLGPEPRLRILNKIEAFEIAIPQKVQKSIDDLIEVFPRLGESTKRLNPWIALHLMHGEYVIPLMLPRSA